MIDEGQGDVERDLDHKRPCDSEPEERVPTPVVLQQPVVRHEICEAAKRNEASPAVLQKNEQSKATVKTSIEGFRESLDKLEIDFRATPELQPYYIKLAGVASGAANAEQQASANQFDAAGRSLLNVVNRLTDVLLAMR